MVTEFHSKRSKNSLKFLCSYGGKIVPRFTDGKLRFLGGVNRVFAVDRSISFAELMLKLVEFCGFSMTMRCQLPNGDLETLISIKSEEDLGYVIEEYDRVCSGSQMIKTVLSPLKRIKQISPPSSVDLSPKSPYLRIHPEHTPLQPQVYSVGRFAGAGCFGCRVQGNSSPVYRAPSRYCHFWQ